MVAFLDGEAIFRYWRSTQQHSFRLNSFCLAAWMRRTKGSEQQMLSISFNMPNISSRFKQIFVFVCGKHIMWLSLTKVIARGRKRANRRAGAIEGTSKWVYFQEVKHQSNFNCFFSHSNVEFYQNNMTSLVFISVECESIALHQIIWFTRATNQSIDKTIIV